jgi:hypothetical protein
MLINDSLRKESASAVEHNLLRQITEDRIGQAIKQCPHFEACYYFSTPAIDAYLNSILLHTENILDNYLSENPPYSCFLSACLLSKSYDRMGGEEPFRYKGS